MTICLFKAGILAGLQFEMDEPPYRINADWMKPNPISMYIDPSKYDPTYIPYTRGADCYKRTEVHIRAQPIQEEHIVVYELERSW